jgi:hypothetical protein
MVTKMKATAAPRSGVEVTALSDRRARQFEHLAQGVGEVAKVGLRHGVGARAEQHEARRPRLGLRYIIQLQPPARYRRRRVGIDGLLEPAIERRGRHPLVPDRVGPLDRAHQPIDPLAHEAGYRNHRHAPDLRQQMIGLGAQRRNQRGLRRHQIPFVDRDHQRPALALDQVGDAQILLFEFVLGIHHHDDDFGKAHRAQRIRHRKLFKFLLDPRAPPQSRGVEHAKVAVLPFDLDGNGIAGGAGFRAGQKPFFAEQMVDQRGLAGVGTADDGDADRTLRKLFI